MQAQLCAQAANGVIYPLNDQDRKNLAIHTVNRPEKVISVSVPEDAVDLELQTPSLSETRESIKMQALIAAIGERMGLSVWIPKADRGAVLREWQAASGTLLERLPLNYDDTTLRTIEQIDVLWLRRRSIVRAFEVEHSTSVYSGILRMADLLALQANMDIKLHLVAPETKREKVFQQIRRPVFSLLERGPLAERCTYISYEGVRQIAELPHLDHMADSVLEDYAEDAE